MIFNLFRVLFLGLLASFGVLACKKSKTKLTTIAETKSAITEIEHKVIVAFQNIDKPYVLGQFNHKTHPDFVKVNPQYTSKTIYLHKDVNTAFEAMRASALKDGITLTILSGTRSFNEQKAIWERKWQKYSNLAPLERAKKILKYSSMPSTSRHHWGTDIDLNSLNNSYFNSPKGKPVYQWLLKHANRFGFYQTYTDKSEGRTGYNEEKWHWSYLPLADNYLKYYNKRITYNDIIGFKGDSLAPKMQMIADYVNGISVKAKQYH